MIKWAWRGKSRQLTGNAKLKTIATMSKMSAVYQEPVMEVQVHPIDEDVIIQTEACELKQPPLGYWFKRPILPKKLNNC